MGASQGRFVCVATPAEIERFLRRVAQSHGEDMRSECQIIIDEKKRQGEESPSLLAVLCQAESNLYGSQIAAAVAAGNLCFDSDGDI